MLNNCYYAYAIIFINMSNEYELKGAVQTLIMNTIFALDLFILFLGRSLNAHEWK